MSDGLSLAGRKCSTSFLVRKRRRIAEARTIRCFGSHPFHSLPFHRAFTIPSRSVHAHVEGWRVLTPTFLQPAASKYRRGLRLILLVLGLGVAIFLTLAWMASSRLICPPRAAIHDHQREILDHPEAHGLVIHSFTVRTSDGYDTPCLMCEPSRHPGVALKGNKVRQELLAQGVAVPPWGDITATLVLLHGHSGRKENFLAVSERFCAAGFRCLMMDLPGHGEHPAPFATFGLTEATLPQEILQEAAKRFSFAPQPAGLFGISQGGAIALQAAARPGATWFVVGELSGFATLDEVIAAESRHLFGPLHQPACGIVHWLVMKRARFLPENVRPIDAVTLLKDQAVLIGHGDADDFVPPEHARRLFAAVPSARKTFLSVPGADHHHVLVTTAPVYATVSAFFLKALMTPDTSAVTQTLQK
jgi:pimeloyl-ACP methyl ester carboxylesterase